MNQLVLVRRDPAPVAALVVAGGDRASLGFVEFLRPTFATRARGELINGPPPRAQSSSGFLWLKLDSPDIPHKTRDGVVRLSLGDAAQVRTAYADILARAKAHLNALPLDGGGLGWG